MDILRPLFRFFGSPTGAGWKGWIGRDRRRENILLPVDLTADQREQIEKRIVEFLEDTTFIHADSHEAVARVHALPLFYDWTAVMALRPDGQIIWIPYDNEPEDVEIINDERLRNFGLFQSARLHPDLPFLVPSRPADAIDCPDCRGTGKLAFPPGREHLAEKVVCSCGGTGWLPHGTKP
jgi:hypothetical protein